VRNPFDEVSEWLRRDTNARAVVWDIDPDSDLPRVTLQYENDDGDERQVEAVASTLDLALIDALDKLPREVRK
jgi:hypothetical protein